MKSPLGTEVDLSPGHIVLDTSPPTKGAEAAPSFRPMSILATVGFVKLNMALINAFVCACD